MKDAEKEEPCLIFFRKTPEKMMNHPPLASALQHLESSFLLLSMGRYPHALVSCGSAIESAIKAGICVNDSKRYNFNELITIAKKKLRFWRNGAKKIAPRILHLKHWKKCD